MKILQQLFFVLAPGLVLADCAAIPVASAANTGAPLCRQWNPAEIEAALRSSASEFIGPADEAHLRIEVLDHARGPLPEGTARFALAAAPPAAADGTSVLHGRIEDGTARVALVWARVRMSVLRDAAVALQNLPARTTLREGQFAQRPVWVPFPQDYVREARVGPVTAGAQLKRAVRAGEVIVPAWLEYPLDIRRGQTVDLQIRAGGARLRLQATALNNARRGESVDLRISDRSTGLAAVAVGPGAAVLEAGNPANNNLGKFSGADPGTHLSAKQGSNQSAEAE